MKALLVISFLLLILHGSVFFTHAFYCRWKLLRYFKFFNRKGILDLGDYLNLGRSQSIFKPVTPLPDSWEYPALFKDSDFSNFVMRARKVRRILGSLVLTFLGLFLFSLFFIEKV
jgi:hypothetical protein